MRAMIVDDSRALRAYLKRMLEPMGFEVHEAGTGLEALAQLGRDGPFQLALVDWNLPGMDGLELVRAVRGGKIAGEVRLIMVTTEQEMDRIAAALESGANEYLMKPFTEDALREKLMLLGLVS